MARNIEVEAALVFALSNGYPRAFEAIDSYCRAHRAKYRIIPNANGGLTPSGSLMFFDVEVQGSVDRIVGEFSEAIQRRVDSEKGKQKKESK